jgi:alanyl-tRNA synthetase
MDSRTLIKKYLEFFADKGHSIIPSSPLIPENDPTVLFTTAGMHPLVPYLLGEKHPGGKRLANVQICVRTGDIDEVGDPTHHTFFEMLGNWSLRDYWKKESISWSWEFLTKVLKIPAEKLAVTCFEGDADAPKDDESAEIWKLQGLPSGRIFFLPKADNWWGPAGQTGPCGPDTEIFYETGKPCGKNCRPGDGCGRFVEIWNNVFMHYEKKKDGTFSKLEIQNVDTGMGVDRTTAVLAGLDDNYLVTDLWEKIIESISKISGKKYSENVKAFRVIADHSRAATFIASEGVLPANKERGYVLRRLVRRSVRYGKMLGINDLFLDQVVKAVIITFKDSYSILENNQKQILETILTEEKKFAQTLERGLREIEKQGKLDGKKAFWLYETYGFPVELTEEIAQEKGQKIDNKIFEAEFQKHRDLSRTASAGMFKGGLADASEEVTKLHTATHLLHKALRMVLGAGVSQKGSNITNERLRFDFSYSQKLTPEELSEIVDIVNSQIDQKLPVSFKTETLAEAKKENALAFFAEKYGDAVKVYTVGNPDGKWFSKEVCGGPHVENTGQIGHVRIIKQEKLGAGIMRIYATNK